MLSILLNNNTGRNMKNIKILFLATSIFTIVSFLCNNASYAQTILSTDRAEKYVKQEVAPLTKQEKDEQFKAVAGDVPEDYAQKLRDAHMARAQEALAERVVVGKKSTILSGRNVVGKGGNIEKGYIISQDKVSGSEFVAGKEIPNTGIKIGMEIDPDVKVTDTTVGTTTTGTTLGTATTGTTTTTTVKGAPVVDTTMPTINSATPKVAP